MRRIPSPAAPRPALAFLWLPGPFVSVLLVLLLIMN
jgi:hypothetical protein